MSNNTGPGPATEILQARVHEQMTADGTRAPEAVQVAAEPPVQEVVEEAPAVTQQAPVVPVIDAAKANTTGRIPLQALPDSEIVSLCATHNIDAKGFTSRAEAENALKAKGIDSVPASS